VTGTPSVLGLAASPLEVEAVLRTADGSTTRCSATPADPSLPDAVWQAVLTATRDVLDQGGVTPTRLGLGSATPTCVMWDVETLGCPLPLAAGTRLAPWLAEVARTSPRTLDLLREGQYAVGPLASYLLARATRGTFHVTDATHAAALGPLPTGMPGGDLPADCLPDLLPGGGVPLDARSFLGLDLVLTALGADRDATDMADLARQHP